ncbi:hypothetical protein TSAR_015967, partial [Trichomalopsis sarcophagae]
MMLILFTLGTRYLKERDDVILSTLGTRYLRERCRHDIRVLQPQKSPSSKTGLISINIYGRKLCNIFYGIEKHYFAFFFNHPIVTNKSANLHLKENKITNFFPFCPRDRPLCSADKMNK